MVKKDPEKREQAAHVPWDDFTQRHAKKKGEMYKKSIDKPMARYSRVERKTYAKACSKVAKAAEKLNIELNAEPYIAPAEDYDTKDAIDDVDSDNGDDDDDGNAQNDKVDTIVSRRSKPKPQTIKQKPGRERSASNTNPTPQRKARTPGRRVAQKQPRNRQNDQNKKEELEEQQDLPTGTDEDTETAAPMPHTDAAADQALGRAARLSRRQTASSALNADQAPSNTGPTPQKRKLEASNVPSAAGTLQDEQGNVEMSDEQEDESQNTGTDDASDGQHQNKKTRSAKPQNDSGNTSLRKEVLQKGLRSRMQTVLSGQNSSKESASPSSSSASESSNDVDMTSDEGEEQFEDKGNAFDNWWQSELSRILLGPAYDLFARKKQRAAEKDEEPDLPTTPAQRVVEFFKDMYDGQLLGDAFTTYVEDMLGKGDIKKPILTIDRDLAADMASKGISPRYELEDVFTSPSSPFSNFRLASAVFEEGLQMLHTNDLDYSGPANQQLVACAKLADRHPIPEDYQFVDLEELAFKRGGRVHKLFVRQQECPILGDNRRWNTAYVCMDVMLCQQGDCEKCSPYHATSLQSATSLPRVHMRHTAGKSGKGKTGVFDEPEVKTHARFNKDEDGKFVMNLAYGIVPMEFWDGTIQDVVLCDQDSCQGCREAHGALPVPLLKKE